MDNRRNAVIIDGTTYGIGDTGTLHGNGWTSRVVVDGVDVDSHGGIGFGVHNIEGDKYGSLKQCPYWAIAGQPEPFHHNWWLELDAKDAE